MNKPHSRSRLLFLRLAPLLAMLPLAVGCRVGGPTGVTEPPAQDAGGVDQLGGFDGPDEGGPMRGPVDAADGDEGTPSDSASDRSSIPAADTADNETSRSCAAPFPSAVCDPVCNVGCPALSRCDVSDTPQTGACVGLWITQEGDVCFKGPTTDACAPQLTCLEGRCHRLCYLDSDCTTAGTCCTRDIEAGAASSGFKACAPC